MSYRIAQTAILCYYHRYHAAFIFFIRHRVVPSPRPNPPAEFQRPSRERRTFTRTIYPYTAIISKPMHDTDRYAESRMRSEWNRPFVGIECKKPEPNVLTSNRNFVRTAVVYRIIKFVSSIIVDFSKTNDKSRRQYTTFRFCIRPFIVASSGCSNISETI